MSKAHTIQCSHDDCPEVSTTVRFGQVDREQVAADHRRSLAEDGWSDVEGRDYCPTHTLEA